MWYTRTARASFPRAYRTRRQEGVAVVRAVREILEPDLLDGRDRVLFGAVDAQEFAEKKDGANHQRGQKNEGE